MSDGFPPKEFNNSLGIFLNNKYDVTLNKKTLERVKNYFK